VTPLAGAVGAAVDFAAALPVGDIAAALRDPDNVGGDAKALEDIVGALPLPPLDAAASELAIAGFAWLIERAQAGAVRPESDTIGDGQTQASGERGGRYVGR
jgi:hypothetical protein